jgi:hypothetical protein
MVKRSSQYKAGEEIANPFSVLPKIFLFCCIVLLIFVILS